VLPERSVRDAALRRSEDQVPERVVVLAPDRRDHPGSERAADVHAAKLILEQALEEPDDCLAIEVVRNAREQDPQGRDGARAGRVLAQVLDQELRSGERPEPLPDDDRREPAVLDHVDDAVRELPAVPDEQVRVAADERKRDLAEERGDGEPVGNAADRPRLERPGEDRHEARIPHSSVPGGLQRHHPGRGNRERDRAEAAAPRNRR
jgi:hypothetical protein